MSIDEHRHRAEALRDLVRRMRSKPRGAIALAMEWMDEVERMAREELDAAEGEAKSAAQSAALPGQAEGA